jgi:hypothetical protein
MFRSSPSAAVAIASVLWLGAAVWTTRLGAANPSTVPPVLLHGSRAVRGEDGGDRSRLQTGQAAAAPQSVSAERALVNRYCVTCHNERRQTPAGAPLMLDRLDIDNVGHDPAVWEKVVRKVRSGAMPPVGLPRPEATAFRTWVESLESRLDRAADAAPRVGAPARVHRLNRAEYVNAVRDLIGLEIDGRDMLPADDSGYGFDNIGDVLSVSPGLLERYMLAAAKISSQALGDPSIKPVQRTYKVSPYLIQTDRNGEDLPFGSRGGIAVRHHFPLDGEYEFKVSTEGPGDQQEVELRLDRKRVTVFKLAGRGPLEVRVPVAAGTRLVGVAFVSTLERTLPVDGRPASVPVTSFEFTQSGIDTLQITGPYDGQVPESTSIRDRIFVCRPASTPDEAACAKQIVSALARRAYRRPVAAADVEPLLQAYEAGRQKGSFEQGIQWALEAVLVSPKFLFRVQQDPAGAAPGQIYRLTDLDLASRLSFFLWSSIPDDELLQLAEQGRLAEPAILDQQVRRMLADPKASALVSNFGGQWLWLRNLRTKTPNADLFPEFDDNLRDALQKETELFLADQIRSDASIVELLSADYTFVNERLARHYGIPHVYGSHFRRVRYPDDRRAGLLGHGSILTATAYENRTSPVIRGKWLLENLLGAPPPPPPPNVPALRENGEGERPTTVRERIEAHRRNPVCASCHAQMDPLGFALENFDAVGKWRVVDVEAKEPIDASGVLVDGKKFNGPAEFRSLLLERQHDFVTTVAEKLLTYGLGRGVEYYDMPVIRRVVRNAEANAYRWSSVISGIVNSKPFLQRQAGESSASREAHGR